MVGREREIKELNKLYEKNKAELVAIYGRRRVGKTYLVDETFSDRITFRHAALSPADEESRGLLKVQLEHFYNSLDLYGMDKTEKPKNWLEAFLLLEKFLQKIDDGSRQVVFLDELPWLDTPHSGFMRAFEGFWNNWGCHRKNLMVIVCGSANSWILDNLINNHGGLYGRVTREIKLSPFNLHECEEYYKENDVTFSRYDIVQSYMIFGGIPYYLEYMDGEKSFAQNVDDIFFAKKPRLQNEFERLFDAVFVNSEAVKSIVRLLYTKNAGYTRHEIIEKLNISDGGRLSRNLNALIASDFIMKYVPFGMSKREEHYKLIDPFCQFYLHFVNSHEKINHKFWQQNTTEQSVVTWRGYAFENVCFNHIEQIKDALGIAGVITTSSAWSKRDDDENGVQIDMLLSRNDNVINMCEIKFYSGIFAVNKSYYNLLLGRQETLSREVSRKMVIHNTLITTNGLKKNEYSGIFTNVITMDDLFKESR
ncbi:MAG: ATP-binding protein [Lachnospiraceae bacterium]|nr:ATP-binding protein [Lachnospiraceae bacterium]